MCSSSNLPTQGNKTQVDQLIKELISQQGTIEEDRAEELKFLASEILRLHEEKGKARIIFVCTHNSRRSQLSELWLRVAADYFKLRGILTFSGGTEATTFNHRMVDALRRAGFSLTSSKQPSSNPEYEYEGSDTSLRMFSKKYDDPFNPGDDFIAVMVCTEADQACPIVPGAYSRVSLPYIDPKRSDNSPDEAWTYDQKVIEIGRELLYVGKLLNDTMMITETNRG